MSQLEKLIQFFRSKPSEASFKEVKRLLEAHGFREDRTSGSHVIFRHADGKQLTIPKKKGRRVKAIYIKKIIEILDLEDSFYVQEED